MREWYLYATAVRFSHPDLRPTRALTDCFSKRYQGAENMMNLVLLPPG